MHLHSEDTARELSPPNVEHTVPTSVQFKVALQGGIDALECHAKIMRTMAERESHLDGCFTQQSYICEADRAEAQLRTLRLLIDAVAQDSQLPLCLLQASERRLGKSGSAASVPKRSSRQVSTSGTGSLHARRG